jgi:hypothetical protein
MKAAMAIAESALVMVVPVIGWACWPVLAPLLSKDLPRHRFRDSACGRENGFVAGRNCFVPAVPMKQAPESLGFSTELTDLQMWGGGWQTASGRALK